MALLPPPPVRNDPKDPAYRDWFFKVQQFLANAGNILFTNLDFTGSNLTSILTRNHADLQNLNTASYTHLTSTQATDLTDGGETSLHVHASSLYTSAGIYVKPTATDNGDGTLTLGSGEFVFYSDTNGTPPLSKHTIAGATYSFTNSVTNYIVANYNSGSPTITVVTSTATIDNTTVIPVYTVFRSGTHLDVLEWDIPAKALSNKLMRRLVRTRRFEAEPGGLTLGESATRVVTITAGNVWNGPHQAILPSWASNVDTLSLYAHVGGVFTKSTITQYNNTQYDNGTDLVTLTNNRYAVNWVFRAVNDNQEEAYIVLGTGDYQLGDAQDSQVPTLPPEISSTSILVGRIIVQKNASSATQIDSALGTTLNTNPVTDHNALSNLQGGTAGEYYHLTAAEAASVTSLAAGVKIYEPTVVADFNVNIGYIASEPLVPDLVTTTTGDIVSAWNGEYQT